MDSEQRQIPITPYKTHQLMKSLSPYVLEDIQLFTKLLLCLPQSVFISYSKTIVKKYYQMSFSFPQDQEFLTLKQVLTLRAKQNKHVPYYWYFLEKLIQNNEQLQGSLLEIRARTSEVHFLYKVKPFKSNDPREVMLQEHKRIHEEIQPNRKDFSKSKPKKELTEEKKDFQKSKSKKLITEKKKDFSKFNPNNELINGNKRKSFHVWYLREKNRQPRMLDLLKNQIKENLLSSEFSDWQFIDQSKIHRKERIWVVMCNHKSNKIKNIVQPERVQYGQLNGMSQCFSIVQVVFKKPEQKPDFEEKFVKSMVVVGQEETKTTYQFLSFQTMYKADTLKQFSSICFWLIKNSKHYKFKEY